ncbi:MAG: penicillin-binding protein 1A [Colwellia sp.]|nr:penicillin-binding protein 1A [Colwellia sp.]
MFSFKRIIKVIFVLSTLALLVLGALYFSMREDLPSVELLKDIQWQTPMQIYSADNKLISQFGEKKRYPLILDQVPQQLINAILATEDDRFYLHFGVDPIGMSRAIIGQLTGKNKGGASTITMQVARNFFLTREQTYIRKLREIFISFHIESLLTKDEILMLYINKIPLGHRSFGFAAAAQVYYGKNLKELSLAQIAVLAGLPKAPSTINPIRSLVRAKKRRAVVLKRMLVSDYITQNEYQEALNSPMTGKRHGAQIELNAPYVAEMAHQEMLSRFGKEQAYNNGYKVFTSITTDLQLAAQHAVITNLLNYDQRHGYRGPVKSLRPLPITEKGINKSEAISDDNTFELNEVKPLTSEEITKALKTTTSYQSLIPAVVTEVLEQSIIVTFTNQQQTMITWQGLSWARQFISDDKQDKEPKFANDITNYGDVIYVTKKEDGSYQLSQLPEVSAALVSISPDNGAIKAAVGGFSFTQSQFNRVTQAKRQVGSNIKPFIYSAALEKGLTLASLVNDAPINQWDRSTGLVWRPKNSPPTYLGTIRVRLALALSKNVIAVRLLRLVGLDNMIGYLSQFGFVPGELPRNETLALGSASLTPLELVTGFATFANGGFLVEPYLIERIEDPFGNIIFQANPKLACDPCLDNVIEEDEQLLDSETNLSGLLDNLPEVLNSETFEKAIEDSSPVVIQQAPRVISEQNAFLIGQALNSVIWGADWNTKPFWNGTGHRARILKRRDIAGKTGTTNESKDAWFSGFTRRLVTTSWIGFDDYKRNLGRTRYNNNLPKNQIPPGSEAGAKSAQPAWIMFMASALPTLAEEPFEPPEGIVSVRIDKATGKLTTKTDRSSQFEYFIVGTEPTEYVTEDNSGNILDGIDTEEEELF